MEDVKAMEREAVHKQVLEALDAACEIFASVAQAASDSYYAKAMA